MKPQDQREAIAKLLALANEMVGTLDELGNTSMARLSAREFAVYYRRKLKRVIKQGDYPM
jgi:hypothetical protein